MRTHEWPLNGRQLDRSKVSLYMRRVQPNCLLTTVRCGTRRGRGKAAPLSQEKLGELAELDCQTVNRLENASHAISTAHLAALADALGVAPSALMPSIADYAARPIPRQRRKPGQAWTVRPVDNSPVRQDP